MYRKKHGRIAITTLIFGIGLGAALFFGIQRWADDISAIITTPFLYIQHTITSTTTRIKNNRREKLQLKEKIAQLEETNKYLMEQTTKNNGEQLILRAQNELVHFAERYQLNGGVIAQVLLKNISENHHFFLVSAGKNRGITKNSIVLAHHQIIGKVTDVYPFYSRVVLITDPTSKIAAECATTKTKGIAEGTGAIDRLKLSFAAHFSQLKDNDLVLSLGTGLIFPRGFGIGKIIKKETNGIFHSAEIAPLLSPENIEQCIIVERAILEKVTPIKQNTANPAQIKKTSPQKTVKNSALEVPRPPQPLPLGFSEAREKPAHPEPKQAESRPKNASHPNKKADTKHFFAANTITNNANVEQQHQQTDLQPNEQNNIPENNNAEKKLPPSYD